MAQAKAAAEKELRKETLRAKGMKEIIIDRETVVDGVVQLVGQTVITSEGTAHLLVGMKKAHLADERDSEVAGGLTTRTAGALVSGK